MEGVRAIVAEPADMRRDSAPAVLISGAQLHRIAVIGGFRRAAGILFDPRVVLFHPEVLSRKHRGIGVDIGTFSLVPALDDPICELLSFRSLRCGCCGHFRLIDVKVGIPRASRTAA